MDERNNHSNTDPWEHHSYGNGSTQPPKSHGGLIALLLGGAIVLCGIISSLGFYNNTRQADIAESSGPISFVGAKLDPSTSSEGTAPIDIIVPAGQVQVQLNPTPDAVENIPQEGGLSLQEIYTKSIPSVVSIACTLDGGSSSGTGVVLSANGYIVTNAHVIDSAREIQVLLTDGRIFAATLVGADALSDLAVLYIDADNLTPAQFGSSDLLQVGDAVVAIGDPLGIELRGTMTDGIVSAINRDLVSGGRTMTLIQTNAALNSGNSGGPLINCYGQVIGINTLKIGAFADSAGVEGLGFAIPSVTVKDVVDQLIAQGYVSGRPALPLEGEWVTYFQQRFHQLPAGLYITHTPEHDTIHAKDILLSVNGIRVTSAQELEQVLFSCQVGDTAELVFYRSGRQYTTTITLVEGRK